MTQSTTGRFNPAIAGLAVPPIPVVQKWAEAYSGEHGPLIDLSQAVPGYPPHPDLLTWLAEAAGSTEFAGYGPIEGETALREAYAAHVSETYGAAIPAGSVHVTAGCNQAFVAVMLALAGPGDTVLMTNPRYFNHETTLAMLGIGTRFVECRAENGFLPDVDEVEAALDGVRALAIVSPNNPTGATYPPLLLAKLFALCARKGVWLVIDETYRDFLPPETVRPHNLFSESAWRGTLIQLYSFSKSFCIPGHRLGAVVAMEEVIRHVAKVMDNLQICAPRPSQAAVARGLAPLADWRAGNAREIARRATAFRRALAGLDGWSIDALGAYFAYLRHPFEGVSSARVAEALARDAGIVSLPGAFFGEGQDRHLRIAFANAGIETIGLVRDRMTTPISI